MRMSTRDGCNMPRCSEAESDSCDSLLWRLIANTERLRIQVVNATLRRVLVMVTEGRDALIPCDRRSYGVATALSQGRVRSGGGTSCSGGPESDQSRGSTPTVLRSRIAPAQM